MPLASGLGCVLPVVISVKYCPGAPPALGNATGIDIPYPSHNR